MPETLQQLVDRIPLAEPGAPITTDLHNTLREVLKLLAAQGVGSTTGPRTLSLAPAFLPFKDTPFWVTLDGGFASPQRLESTAGTRIVEGWIPVQLPEGARIDSMLVKGRRSAKIDMFQLRLGYTPLDPDENARTIIPINNLANASDPFAERREVSIPGVSGATLLDARTVKNDSRIYFVTARVEIPPGGIDGRVEINSIQVNYTMEAS